MASRRRPKRSLGRKAPLKVIQSWIWDVFTPQIDHLRYEQHVLAQSLTFRSPRRFERLLPLRDGLMSDGQHVFDDLQGDVPEYDRLVVEHDRALEALRARAEALYSELEKSESFQRLVHEIIEELRVKGERAPPVDAEPDWVRYLAADVVNDHRPDLPADHSEWLVWNRGADRLKRGAPGEPRAAVMEGGAQFAAGGKAALDSLFALRKSLSREYDIPVVPPVTGAHVEGALD